MRLIEVLEDTDKWDIIDLEARIIKLKQDLLDASSEERESIKADIEDLKQDIVKIKERGKEWKTYLKISIGML